MLLANGRVVYSGPAQQPVIDHFASLGYHCPVGFNMADYFVDLTMHANKVVIPDDGNEDDNVLIMEESIGMLSTTSNPGFKKISIREEQEGKLYGKSTDGPSEANGSPAQSNSSPNARPGMTSEFAVLLDSYLRSPVYKAIMADINQSIALNYSNTNSQTIARSRSIGRPSHAEEIRERMNRSMESLFTTSKSNRASWWTQFKILSGRTLKNLVRNPNLLLTHYVISVLVALICGVLFWKVDNSLAGFQNRLGVMFFICALFGFGCLSSMGIFASERLIFIRERANRYYSPFTYFVSKILFDMIPLRVVPPFILGLICYNMIGLRPEVECLMKFLLVLVLFNMTAASCCFALSIIFKEIGVANLVATLVMLFEMLFGGLLLNKATIPATFQWLDRLSFFNYAFEALVVNEVSKLVLVEEKYGLKIDVPTTDIGSRGAYIENIWFKLARLLG